RCGPDRPADEVPSLPGGRDSAGGACPRLGRAALDHAALHGRPGTPGPPSSRAVFLAASPLEAPAEGEEGQTGGVSSIEATQSTMRPRGRDSKSTVPDPFCAPTLTPFAQHATGSPITTSLSCI